MLSLLQAVGVLDCEPLSVGQDVCRMLSHLLWRVRISSQTRNKTQTEHRLKWQFSLGVSCNALDATGFTDPHNFRIGRGVHLTPVNERDLPQWKKAIWVLCLELVKSLDSEWVGENNEIAVSVSCIDSNGHYYVKKHKDSEDMSYQWALFLGDFSGAILRLFEENGETVLLDVVLKPNLILKMDGRLAHELLLQEFTGVRFAVFFYKSYDRRMNKPADILKTPTYFIV